MTTKLWTVDDLKKHPDVSLIARHVRKGCSATWWPWDKAKAMDVDVEPENRDVCVVAARGQRFPRGKVERAIRAAMLKGVDLELHLDTQRRRFMPLNGSGPLFLHLDKGRE